MNKLRKEWRKRLEIMERRKGRKQEEDKRRRGK
jgi:hypothetical protein